MADPKGPGKTDQPLPYRSDGAAGDDLDRRRRDLESKLAARRPADTDRRDGGGRGDASGFGKALRLSSEFIAAIVVGAGIGWFFDQYVGSSPWGLIVFLLLGFGAGVLNVMRSAGLVAEVGPKPPSGGADKEAE